MTLGPHTKSASPRKSGGVPVGVARPGHTALPSTDCADDAEKARLARRRRYSLQKTASDLLPGSRVERCGWRPPPGGQIGISLRDGRHFVSGAAVCGSVWTCPVCAAKIALKRAEEVERAVEAWTAQKGRIMMAALTVDHGPTDDLHELLDKLLEAVRQTFAGKWGVWWRRTFGQVGAIRNLEATWGLANGWHPHCHLLLFTRSALSVKAEVALKRRWQSVASRYGFKVSLQRGATLELAENAKHAADYATKADEGGSWGMAQELTWANIKNARGARYTPFALLSACDGPDVGAAPMLFQTYADAFRGRRQLVWSRGLRDLLALEQAVSDEDAANARDDKAEFVAVVATDIFCWVKARGLVCDLLEAADEHGLLGIDSFIEWAYDCRMLEAADRRRGFMAA